jgi:hypothetical protein
LAFQPSSVASTLTISCVSRETVGLDRGCEADRTKSVAFDFALPLSTSKSRLIWRA